jgi:hypothetical protein
LLRIGTAVRLEADPRLDRVDGYGRQLRYVWRGGMNVNVELVRRGAATVWFYDGERGKYASKPSRRRPPGPSRAPRYLGRLQSVWNPYAPTTVSKSSLVPRRSGCDPSYPTVCIPSLPLRPLRTVEAESVDERVHDLVSPQASAGAGA